jgi:hypothetical protein
VIADAGSLDYALARLHARHGERADTAAWQRLAVAREFATLLDAARASPLQRWLGGITPHSDAHAIEAVLRERWRSRVAEVITWMPARWQGALAWCGLWPDLAPLQHLLRGGEPAAWMRDEPLWQQLASAQPAARGAVLAAAGLGALLDGAAPRLSLLPAWSREWQRRAPAALGDEATTQALVATLRAHGAAFAAAPVDQAASLRSGLRARLALLLRRATLQPAAVFIHLLHDALELERLRGELLDRRLFTRSGAA